MRSSTIALLAAAATAPAANAAVFLACQSSLIEQGLLKGKHKHRPFNAVSMPRHCS